MSDVVYFITWVNVDVPKFFNPMTTALQPRDLTWQGMKTVAELRKERNLPVPVNKDSLYKVVSHDLFFHLLFASSFKIFLLSLLLDLLCLSGLTLHFSLYMLHSQWRERRGNLIHWSFPSHCKKHCLFLRSLKIFLKGVDLLKLEELLLQNLMRGKPRSCFSISS